jgi:calcineurin-like phosphoesterase
VKPVVERFLDGMPRKFEVAEGDVRISGALVDYDEVGKRTVKVELLHLRRGR